MVKLEAYSGLTKKQEDLLRTQYCFKALAVLALNTAQGDLAFNFRTSKKSEEDVLASLWLQYNAGQLTLKGKKRNDTFSNYSAEWVPQNYIANVKLKTECKLTGRQMESNTSAEYSTDNAKGKITFNYNPMQLKAAVTAGRPECGLGADLKYDIEAQRLHGYNLAAWWAHKYRRVVVKHEGTDQEEITLGDVLVSYYQRLSKVAHLGALVRMNWESKETQIQVGGDYLYDALTTVKGRVSSDGLVGLALSRKMNEYWTVGAAVELDATSASFHYSKFGFKVAFKY